MCVSSCLVLTTPLKVIFCKQSEGGFRDSLISVVMLQEGINCTFFDLILRQGEIKITIIKHNIRFTGRYSYPGIFYAGCKIDPAMASFVFLLTMYASG